MKKNRGFYIQGTNFEKRKIASYDVEQISEATNPIMHQESRFLFFIKGRGIMKINNVPYEIKPNSCVTIVPWVITEVVEVLETLQYIKIIYNFNFLTHNIKTAYSHYEKNFDLFSEISNTPIIYCNDFEANNFEKIMEDIKAEVGVESILDVRKEKILTNVFLTNKIIEMIILFVRIEQKINLSIDNNSNPSFDERAAIFKYLYSHLSEKQTLKSVSEIFFMSESSLSKYCQKVTGHSFHSLLNEMRLVKTMDFLVYSDFSLNMIAELVGFNDASHLSKFFGKRIGTTPNQYRKINQNVINMLNLEEKSITYELIGYISNLFTENINDVDIAREFNISTTEMNKILLYTLEKDFYNFLNYLRINYACELLKTTDENIVNIAISVGYNNSKTFNNHFIKLKKMTPSKFRKTVEIQYDYE